MLIYFINLKLFQNFNF